MEYDSNYSLTREIGNKLGITDKNYDSTYSILKEILPLVEDAASTIKTVDVLPDVQTKYNNLYRLTTDDNVYMAITKSTFETNTLPDKQQIGKAYIFENYDSVHYYNGFWTVKLKDGTLTGYGWLKRRADDSFYLIVTEDNAVISSKVTDAYEHAFGLGDGDTISVDFENHIVTMNENETINNWNWSASGGWDSISGYGTLIPATYNAPESIQIGNAYVNDESTIYTGEKITLVVSDGERTGWKWSYVGYDSFELSDKPASEMYCKVYEGQTQSYNICDTKFIYVDAGNNWTVSGNTYTNLDLGLSDIGWLSIEDDDIRAIYIPQLNAPESAQIGAAYINGNSDVRPYQGEITIQCDDGNVTVYLWSNDVEYPETSFITKIPASEIYTENIDKVAYMDDFPNWVSSYPYVYNGTMEEFNDEFSENEFEVEQGDFELVKQTRTEIQYGWKKLITEDDI